MARRTATVLLTALLIASFAVSAFASNGTQIGTVGARSTALGSNFRGLADDWSAFFFNPAGLTQLGKLTIGFSGGIIAPRGSYTPIPMPVSPYSGLYTDERKLVDKNFFVPAFGAFYKLTEKLTVGAGLCAPFGLGAEFDIYNASSTYGNARLSESLNGNEMFSDHQVANLQAMAAYKLSEKWSVGGGVGYIPIGKMKLNQVNLPELLKVQPVLTNLVAILKGTRVWVADQDRVVAFNSLDGDGSAMSASFGVLFKPIEKLGIGVSGRYCTDLKLTGTFNQRIHLPGATASYPVAIKGYFAQVPGPNTMDSLMALGALGLAFSGATIDTTYQTKANLPLPITVGAGVSYKPFPRLTLVADISWTQWSKWSKIDVENTINGRTTTVSMEEDWNDTFEYGMGAEYRAIAKENMMVDLRAGFYTTASPAPNKTVNPTLLDPSRRFVITGGFGVTVGKVILDLAGEYVIFTNDTPASVYFYDNRGMPTNYPGKYDINAMVITVGATINL